MPRPVDTFFRMNESGYRWFGEPDQPKDGKMGTVKSMSLSLCSDLYGGDELDKEIMRNYIPPVSAFDGIANRYLLATTMNRNKEKVKIVSDCGCVGVKKILHHPDKDDPFTVKKMCLTCHGREHRQTRNDEKLLLVSMLATKLLIERGNAWQS